MKKKEEVEKLDSTSLSSDPQLSTNQWRGARSLTESAFLVQQVQAVETIKTMMQAPALDSKQKVVPARYKTS